MAEEKKTFDVDRLLKPRGYKATDSAPHASESFLFEATVERGTLPQCSGVVPTSRSTSSWSDILGR